jgi:hypothetical protein
MWLQAMYCIIISKQGISDQWKQRSLEPCGVSSEASHSIFFPFFLARLARMSNCNSALSMTVGCAEDVLKSKSQFTP